MIVLFDFQNFAFFLFCTFSYLPVPVRGPLWFNWLLDEESLSVLLDKNLPHSADYRVLFGEVSTFIYSSNPTLIFNPFSSFYILQYGQCQFCIDANKI